MDKHTTEQSDMLTVHGMKCPDCGACDSFAIEIPTVCYMTPDGIIDTDGNSEFDDDNRCMCDNRMCPEYGTWQTVGYFRAKENKT